MAAEHVDNVRQEAFLRAFGCDFFQGFLYSRALPAERFLDFVRQHARPDIGTQSLASRRQA